MIIDRLYSLNCKPPQYLQSWLTYTKMLTKKLYSKSQDTSLNVLQNGIIQPTWWDKYTLGITDDVIFNREITISAHSIPCWYARTIIPINTFYNHKKLFSRLDTESLGDLIFGNNNIKRNQLKYYCIGEENIEYHWLANSIYNDSTNLWTRLSEFEILHDNFYLLEIFLPELEKYN